MKKFRKIAIQVLGYLLVLTLAIVGTVAYLQDTDSNVNVFELSDGVHITMDEAPVELMGDEYVVVEGDRVQENTYPKVYPSTMMPKDPTIHVDEMSDDCYLRAKVTVSGGKNWLFLYGNDDPTAESNFRTMVCNTVGEGWVFMSGEISGEDVIFTLIYEQRMKKGESTMPIFSTVHLPAETTYADYALITKTFHVDVLGEAIQAAGFKDAFHAFEIAQA